MLPEGLHSNCLLAGTAYWLVLPTGWYCLLAGTAYWLVLPTGGLPSWTAYWLVLPTGWYCLLAGTACWRVTKRLQAQLQEMQP